MANQGSSFTIGKINKMVCPPDKQQVIYWDSSNSGYFGIRVTKNQAKSFILQARLSGQTIRTTLGSVNQITIKDALEIAQTKLLEIKKGIDPRVSNEKAKQRIKTDRVRGISGLDAWDKYLEWGKSKNEPWGARHFKDHMEMVRIGGDKITRGLKKGKSDIRQDGVLRSLLNQPLKNITREKVEKWLNNEIKVRPTRARLEYAMLKAFFNWLGNHSEYQLVIQQGACDGLQKELPKAKAKNDALEKEQLKVWFEQVNQISNKTIKAYLQILLLTGARRNELATLEWKDVDLTWNKITIRDKVEGTRQISLTPYIAKLLNELPRINQYVFASSKSKLGYLTEPTKAHNQAIQNAGLPHLSIHGVRRSFGTLAEWVECPEGITHQIMGHKPSGIAEKHYRRRPIDLLRMWHTKIEKFILDEAGIIQPTWEELKEQKKLSLVK
jgi:integrase